MIMMKHKPSFLPQISAPYTEVINQLDDEDVDYKMVDIDPNKLNPTQGLVFANEIPTGEIDNENPIWISKDNDVADGHHRMVKGIIDNNPTIRAIQIDMEIKDLCRLLNKIQDIYDYSQKLKLEETTANDYINDYNSPNSDQTETNDILPLNKFLHQIEEDNELEKGEAKTVIGYRKDPIKENSVVGNFFFLKPIEGFTQYEIDFENLLDTNDFGIQYKDSQNPIDILAKAWFPHMNFKLLAEKYNISEDKIKNKTIAEKAKSLGFDGIKYGDSFLQGL